MKKWMALILVVAMMLALTACGGGTPESSVAGKVEPSVKETETVEPETEAPAQSVVTMGRMEGGTYTNEYTGYGCDLDESWIFYGAEELQDLPENVQELLADTELGDTMEGVVQFTDMMAENVDALVSVNVLYQKLSAQERLAYALLSDDQILDETLALKDTMIEAYAQAGMEVESIEKVTVNFLGQDRVALRTVSSVNGVAQYLLQVFDFHLGQYSVTLTATSFIEDNTQWVLDQFYPVD